jgi:hypothetical protein
MILAETLVKQILLIILRPHIWYLLRIYYYYYYFKLILLIIFLHTPNVLCYVVLSYRVLVTTPHLTLFVYVSVLMCFSLQCLPVICL